MEYHYLVKGKESYYSIDIEDKILLESKLIGLKQIYSNTKKMTGVESNMINKFVSILLQDEQFVKVIKHYYVEKQIGIKSLIKLLDNIISYSSLRSILIKIGVLNRDGNNHNYLDEQCKMRSYNALNKITPNYPSIYTHQHLMYNSNKQGVQGYYFSKLYNKNIWIRSTFEYIVIDHLERNNIKYSYEMKEYTLLDGRKYRPDFHILNNDSTIKYLIEIKSNYYISHQDDKAFRLKEQISDTVFVIFNVEGICEFFDIKDIKPKQLYNKKLKEWKSIRRMKHEI